MNRKTITTEKKKVTSFHLIWMFVGVFIVSTVYLTIQSSATGAKLAELENERLELVESNKDLSRLLMQKTSLTKIQEEADNLGFVQSSDRLYIKSQPSTFADRGSSF